ncbi:HAMP domain-containing sensor histidine kinase [Nocardioides sp.]|uniref:sensor histidine kinase n=1 Tax=Nocardioides sp. TaxID=35761 RepID=UPI002D7E8AD0|nr:HAMP domain-containing sensor histidine kinase [Nocardioides sp.]HET8961125.1 HAMP domain-containing sensor histidine kinase [Nocardioides sp.]
MRTRITVVVALLVALALTGAGLIIYTLGAAEIENDAQARAEQEIAEFRTLGEGGVDPDSGRRFASIDRLLEVFLLQNVAGDDELLVTWVDGEARLASPSPNGEALAQDPEFKALVNRNLEGGGTVRTDSRFGDLMVTIQPVQGGNSSGALVIVTFLDEAQRGLNELIRTYAITALLSLIVITGLAAWQAGRLLAPVGRLSDTAEEISATDLSRRLPETGNDDITALTRTVNGMLVRLEDAFVGQRQFLDDAGHELRTPLTVLRGHLELLDEGDPQDVAETRALLLDELDRMARLVGDLILLAKTGRPDFLAIRPVDLEPLTRTVLAKARGLGDRAWRLDAAGDAVVRMDEQRITQAVLQLADNAVKHTEAGDEIAIGSSVDADGARIWVRDTGPGVPAGDHERIFDRFARSEVAEDDEGFGLGLSIVSAIAEAHAGTVTVEDAVPTGACFVIRLPLQPDQPTGTTTGATTTGDPWRAS